MNYLSYHWLNWQRQAACGKAPISPLSRCLQATLPVQGRAWQDVEFIAVDLETTGLNPMAHEIASMGWVIIERGGVRLASAEHHISKTQAGVGQSAAIHGITDGQLQAGKSLKQILDKFLVACRGRIPVFHNAGLDLGFINTACLRCYDLPFITPFVDTLQLEKDKLHARAALIGPGSLRLHACRKRYHLPEVAAHNALEDALATAELFLAWANHRTGQEHLSWDEAV